MVPKKPFLVVATPCYGGLVTQRYMYSIVSFVQRGEQAGLAIVVDLLGYESMITRGRNTLVSRFLDIEAATPPEELHHWKLFQDACRYRGLAGALALLPADIRAAYEAAISDASATLWRPDDLWKTWPEALNTSGLLPA